MHGAGGALCERYRQAGGFWWVWWGIVVVLVLFVGMCVRYVKGSGLVRVVEMEREIVKIC